MILRTTGVVGTGATEASILLLTSAVVSNGQLFFFVCFIGFCSLSWLTNLKELLRD